MKGKNDFITVDQTIRDAFYSGMKFGILLGEMSKRIAPKLIGRSEKEIERILEKEIKIIFKKRRRSGAVSP